MYQVGSFGSLGVPAASNVPGSRAASSMVIDTVAQILFVFGGYEIREAACT